MPDELMTLTCTSCGKEIAVPAGLESFSCLYCGAKLRMADYLRPTLPADEADRAFAEAHLLDCVRDFPNYYRQFTRKKYEASYEKHLEAVRPMAEALDRWVCAQPAKRDAILTEFAALFVSQWEEYHLARARSKRARSRMEFADKLTLAWYTVPAIRGLGLSISEDFPRVLRDTFVARYPENVFELGAYEEIRAGFRRHGLGLFRRS